MSDLVTLTRDGDIGVVTINNPPVNALSPGVPEGISESIDELAADGHEDEAHTGIRTLVDVEVVVGGERRHPEIDCVRGAHLLERITVEVGSGIKSADAGAKLYDEDVKKQAQQLGLEGW